MGPMNSRSFHLNRRAMVLAIAASPAVGLAAPCPPTRVLFVCPAGTVKSPIARELLKQEAKRRGLALDVISRGVAVEDHVSEGLAGRLRTDGIDPAGQPALPLGADDVTRADLIIAFDAAAEDPRLGRARGWRTPSWNADYDAAKPDMVARIAALADELQRTSAGCR
jgi:protein-tyrosine-phosphatase